MSDIDDLVDNLLIALRNFDSTKTAHDEAMHECEHSWGYYGHRYITALDKDSKEVGKRLIDVIDARIIELTKGEQNA